jgi:hypothetical protein
MVKSEHALKTVPFRQNAIVGHSEKSYGFRTFRCLELALYHSLGKLTEAESFL